MLLVTRFSFLIHTTPRLLMDKIVTWLHQRFCLVWVGTRHELMQSSGLTQILSSQLAVTKELSLSGKNNQTPLQTVLAAGNRPVKLMMPTPRRSIIWRHTSQRSEMIMTFTSRPCVNLEFLIFGLDQEMKINSSNSLSNQRYCLAETCKKLLSWRNLVRMIFSCLQEVMILKSTSIWLSRDPAHQILTISSRCLVTLTRSNLFRFRQSFLRMPSTWPVVVRITTLEFGSFNRWKTYLRQKRKVKWKMPSSMKKMKLGWSSLRQKQASFWETLRMLHTIFLLKVYCSTIRRLYRPYAGSCPMLSRSLVDL